MMDRAWRDAAHLRILAGALGITLQELERRGRLDAWQRSRVSGANVPTAVFVPPTSSLVPAGPVPLARLPVSNAGINGADG
jgi:hypothetical protein